MAYTPSITRIIDGLSDWLKEQSQAGRIDPPIAEFLYYFDPEVEHGYPCVLMVPNMEAPADKSKTKIDCDFQLRVLVTMQDKNNAQRTLIRSAWQVLHAINRDPQVGGKLIWKNTRYLVRGKQERAVFSADISFSLQYSENYSEDI